jgi:hypothetical protein
MGQHSGKPPLHHPRFVRSSFSQNCKVGWSITGGTVQERLTQRHLLGKSGILHHVVRVSTNHLSKSVAALHNWSSTSYIHDCMCLLEERDQAGHQVAINSRSRARPVPCGSLLMVGGNHAMTPAFLQGVCPAAPLFRPAALARSTRKAWAFSSKFAGTLSRSDVMAACAAEQQRLYTVPCHLPPPGQSKRYRHVHQRC